VKFAFIDAEKAEQSVTTLCRALGVSKSGFYAWKRRRPSKREQSDRKLMTSIVDIFERSMSTYGSPRVHAELREQGTRVGQKRVARLMRLRGLRALVPKRRKKRVPPGVELAPAGNVLDRAFDVAAPNRCWAADITYVWTWQGWLYLAVVIDLFSRRVVGWAAGDHMRTSLVLEALDMAIGRRVPGDGLLHHSDRGSQYASDDYTRRLRRHGIECSMSRRGDCYDNAVVESFFGTMKSELVYRQSWPTRKTAKQAIGQYIETFYNPFRRHSYLGMKSPADFERCYAEQAQAA
jgi:transposase InsO family protein